MRAVRPVQLTPDNVESNVPMDDAPVWAANTTYAIGDPVIYQQMLYEALVAGNSGSMPPDRPSSTAPRWLLIGPVNRWRMFNKRAGNKWLIGQYTENPELIDVTIRPGTVVNSVGIIGASASEIQIIMRVDGQGEVFNQTFNMIGRDPVRNWYQHWFNQFMVKSSLATFQLPAYGNAEVQIIARYPNSVAKIGTLVVGAVRDIGVAVYGSGLNYSSYSRTTEDDFGNVSIVSRGSRRTNEFDVHVPTDSMSGVVEFLDRVRDEPTLYVGAEHLGATIVVGWLRSYPVVIANKAISTMNLEVRSLE